MLRSVLPTQFDEQRYASTLHAAVLAERRRCFYGRDAQLAEMAKHAEEAPQAPIVVSGLPGSGKTALVAKYLSSLEEAAAAPRVFFHSAGTSPLASKLRRMLQRLVHFLDPQELVVPTDLESLVGGLPEKLDMAAAASGDGGIVLVFDGIDQLREDGHIDFLEGASVQSMAWFPVAVPDKVRVLLTTRPGEVEKSLKQRGNCRFVDLSVASLSDTDRAQITRYMMAQPSKMRAGQVLSDPNVQMRLRDDSTRNPIILRSLLSELFLIGNYESLATRVPKLMKSSSVADIVGAGLAHVSDSFEVSLGGGGVGVRSEEFLCDSLVNCSLLLSCARRLDTLVWWGGLCCL